MDVELFKELSKEGDIDYLIKMFKDSNDFFEKERVSMNKQGMQNFYVGPEHFYHLSLN